MTPQRPHFLSLTQIRLPIGAFVSILHRASGAGLALAVPLLLYALGLSLASAEGHAAVAGFFGSGLGWLLGLGLTWALVHHFLAGLRHLGFDLGLGEARTRARQTAWLSLVLALVLALGLWGAT